MDSKKQLVLIAQQITLLWRKKILIVLVAILFASVAALRIAYGPRSYEAEATVLVSPPPFRASGGEEISGMMPKTLKVQDYKQLLESYGVLDLAVDKLEGSPYWTPEELKALRNPSALGGNMKASTEVIEKTPSNIVYSVVITLKTRSDEPERAAALAQAWADAGVELVRQYTGASAKTSVTFLEGEYHNVDKELTTAEDDLNLSQDDYAVKIEEYDNETDVQLQNFNDDTGTLTEEFSLDTDLQVASFDTETQQLIAGFEDETAGVLLDFDHATDDLVNEFQNATDALLAQFDDETDAKLMAFDDETDARKTAFDAETDTLTEKYEGETDALLMAYDAETLRLLAEFDTATKTQAKTLADTHEQKIAALEADLKINLAEDEISVLSTLLHEYQRNLLGIEKEQRTETERLKQLQASLDEQPKYLVVSKAITNDALWNQLKLDAETGALPDQLGELKLRDEILNPVYQETTTKIIDCRSNLETMPVETEFLQGAIKRENEAYDAQYRDLKSKTSQLDTARRANNLEMDVFDLGRIMEREKLTRDQSTGKTQLTRQRDTGKAQLIRDRNTSRDKLVREQETARAKLARDCKTERGALERGREMDMGKAARERNTEKDKVQRERTRLQGDLQRDRNVKQLALTRGRGVELAKLERARTTLSAKLERGRLTDQDVLMREAELHKERLARLVAQHKDKYEALAGRYLTARLAAADDTADIAIVGPVLPPDVPTGLGVRVKLMAALVFGLSVGVILVLLNYWLRWLFATVKELEKADNAAKTKAKAKA